MSSQVRRELVLGVGGGISAYKSAELLRRLQDQGFLVTVIPTRSSLNFVGTATWEALSGRQVPIDLWNRVHEVPHISLAKNIAGLIIAPATADLIARLAQGRADDLLTNVVLATTAPIILVPAMHPEMWSNSATVANVGTLRDRGVLVIEPESGRMTGDDYGVGRYPEIASIVSQVNDFLGHQADLSGKRVLVSAGGTREPLDSVRYIGNNSSGKQGYAIAFEAARRGAHVTLVSAHVTLPDIQGVDTIKVGTAQEMHDALAKEFAEADILFMTAAVADARPKDSLHGKLEKDNYRSIELVQNPDILAELGKSKSTRQVIVAFAAQGDVRDPVQVERASMKLKAKNADLIYLNDVVDSEIFSSNETEGIILTSQGSSHLFDRAPKSALATKLIDLALDRSLNKLG